MRQSFEIPGRLPGCNEYTELNRTHPKLASRTKRETEDVIIMCAKLAGMKPMRDPIDVHVTFVEPNMRRDKDNIHFAVKFILDALKKLGIIKDDNWRWIGGRAHDGLSYSYRVNKKNPRVIVELEEL